jgi:hypothetical protein
MEKSTEYQEKYEAQTSELYKSIGKCTVKFEHVCCSMQSGIIALLKKDGLQTHNLAEILIADTTAQPLKSILQAIIGEFGMTEAEKKICDNIFKQIQKLIERRNEIIHSTWFISDPFPINTDFTKISSQKWRRGKKGAIRNNEVCTALEFEEFATKCELVSALIDHLWSSINFDKSIEETLSFTAAGDVTCPPEWISGRQEL